MATTEERLRILKLIEEGKITADEGARLISAIGEAATEARQREDDGQRRWLRVVVTDTYSGQPRVNVRIPAGIVDMALRLGVHFIPDNEGLDLDELMAALKAGATGKVVDVMDEDEGQRVEVYID
jgi:hypothetical protein